jgi:sialate O-acetylesterase
MSLEPFRCRRILMVFAVLVSACLAEPSLPTLFTDHMVVQRDRPIHIWGKADEGERLTVDLSGHTGTATADASGHWSLFLPAMNAGGPFTLTIHGNKQITIKDVMIGEVWLASGQSNMAFALAGAEGADREIPKADYPQIRLFTVPQRIALSPQGNTLPAHWEVCSPDHAKHFSAVSYFFARDVYMSLGVPIGIVVSAWPGTLIEEWISPQEFQADAALKSILDQVQRMSPDERKFAENSLPFELQYDDFELVAAGSDNKVIANFDDGTSRTTTGGDFSYTWTDSPDSLFDLVAPGRDGKGFAARITGRLDGAQGSTLTVRYKLDGTSVDLRPYAGIRFWVRGNGSFRFRSLQPTISDYDNYTTDVVKATPDWQQVTIWFRDLRQEGWGVSLPFTQDSLSGFSIESLTTLGYAEMPVTALYQGMIAPLMPYAFRGALWYQGESNALKAHQYQKLLPALIRSWRQASGNRDLEFLIVQLPNHGAIPEQPSESAWAELREAQLLTLKHTSHTGLAVTIDVGDPANVHPHRKLEVGHRLALWALGTAYKQPIVYSGPLYESMQVRGNEIVIHFSHPGAGLEARGGGPLQGFAIAGADRKFHWAEARIEGDSVLVSSSAVPQPVAVRYAWGDSPPCNLFNKDGLPASQFRTDDWPGITGD